jgi:hypothetical protein
MWQFNFGGNVMREPVPSVHDQKEPSGQPHASAHGKKVSNKKENKKPAEKSRRPPMLQSPTMTTSDSSLQNNPSTNDSIDPRIAERAYELWQHRGGHHGQDLEDWLTAEREVLSEEECCS